MGCLPSRPAKKEQQVSHHGLVRGAVVCRLPHLPICGTLHMQMVRLLHVLQIDPSLPTQQPDSKAADAKPDVMVAKIAGSTDSVDMSADSRCKPWVVPEGVCKLQQSRETMLSAVPTQHPLLYPPFTCSNHLWRIQ